VNHEEHEELGRKIIHDGYQATEREMTAAAEHTLQGCAQDECPKIREQILRHVGND